MNPQHHSQYHNHQRSVKRGQWVKWAITERDRLRKKKGKREDNQGQDRTLKQDPEVTDYSNGRTPQDSIPEYRGVSTNTYPYLQRCFEKGVQIAFVKECWKNKEGTVTTMYPYYKVGSRITKESKIMIYWSNDVGEEIKVITENTNTIWIQIRHDRIVGVYGRCKSTVLEYIEWTHTIGNMVVDREGVVVGDWNAHHEQQSLIGKGDSQGRALKEQATERDLSGYTLRGRHGKETNNIRVVRLTWYSNEVRTNGKP